MNERIKQKLLGLCRANIELPQARSKHFTFILLRNKIISMGWNCSEKTHPIAKKFGYRFDSIHSEFMAVHNSPFVNNKCILVNIRLLKDLQIGMAKPCRKCKFFLSAYRFRDIWYTDSSGEFVRL